MCGRQYGMYIDGSVFTIKISLLQFGNLKNTKTVNIYAL